MANCWDFIGVAIIVFIIWLILKLIEVTDRDKEMVCDG